LTVALDDDHHPRAVASHVATGHMAKVRARQPGTEPEAQEPLKAHTSRQGRLVLGEAEHGGDLAWPIGGRQRAAGDRCR